MPYVARIGDEVTGICNGTGHTAGRAFIGIWVTGSSTVFADGIGVVRVDDTGTTDCGHNIKATGGSSKGDANGLSLHRVGDAVTVIEGGTGTTTTGSSTILVD